MLKEVDGCWLWIAWGCAWEYVCMLAENTVVKCYGSYWSIRIWMGGYYFIELTSNITGNWLEFRIKLLHHIDCSSKFCFTFKLINLLDHYLYLPKWKINKNMQGLFIKIVYFFFNLLIYVIAFISYFKYQIASLKFSLDIIIQSRYGNAYICICWYI